MKKYSRFAIYYAPPKGSGLEEFGKYWFGWDPLNAKFINKKQRINSVSYTHLTLPTIYSV